MRTFDIFSGTPKHDPIWQCAIEGQAEAVLIMKRLADEKPGPYFAYDTERATVLAVVSGPTPKPETKRKSRSNAA
jgi:hypothetical protein